MEIASLPTVARNDRRYYSILLGAGEGISFHLSHCAPLISFEIYSDTGETKGSSSLFSHFFFEAFGEVYDKYDRFVSNVITTYRISIPIAILDIQDVLIKINR